MGKMTIQDCYTIVYLLGWVVVIVGVYMAMSTGLSGKNDNTGLSVIFGGLYMTCFVRNSQLKLQLAMLEKEMQEE